MTKQSKKILIAAGGTGGHLFPAQALADGLLQKKDQVEVLFSGKGLASNRYFHKERFSFRDISSGTPRRGSIFRSLWDIVRGTKEAMRILKEFKPDLLVGFGSYHTFPLLAAALLKRIPIALFEPNSIPGRVNRLFSRFALLSAVQFSEAADQMRGPTAEVSIPLWQRGEHQSVSVEEARHYFGLSPNVRTLLVFGGSQGASAINKAVSSAVEMLSGSQLQLIHITGSPKETQEMRERYLAMGLSSCVKDFETKMHFAWKAADVAICRAGAATLGELIAFEVPGILIPFPLAADDHQTKNALFLEREVQGGIHIAEKELTAEKLKSALEEMLSSQHLDAMRQAIIAFKTQRRKADLCSLICELL